MRPEPLGDCFLGELDPFTGTIATTGAAGPLVRLLTLLLASNEIVLMPPGCMVEHPLVLPAFEALAPFVRAGRLGSSGQRGTPGPLADVTERAEKAKARWAAAVRLKSGPCRAEWRHAEAHQVLARWTGVLTGDALRDRYAALLPERWAVVRDVPASVHSYGESVRDQLRVLAERGSAAAAALTTATKRLADVGTAAPDRNDLLPWAARLAGDVAPDDLARSLVVLQAAYFEQGTSRQLKWRADRPAGAGFALFPGAFARRQAQLVARVPDLHPLPIDDWLRPENIAAELARVGVTTTWLFALSAPALFELVADPVWTALVSRLRRGEVTDEAARAIRGRLTRDPRDDLHRIDAILAAPAPTVLPAPWQLAVQAKLGSLLGEGEAAAALDWPTRELRAPDGRCARASEEAAWLLALLAIHGDVAVDDVARVLLELDAMASRPPVRAPEPPLPGAPSEPALRARVDQARCRLASLLRPFGLALGVARGRWSLAAATPGTADAAATAGTAGAATPRLALRNTPWSLALERVDAARPARLSGQKARVWDLLAASAPAFVTPAAVARALGRDDDAPGKRYASKVVHDLRAALAGDGGAWEVEGRHARGYRLVPRLPVV